MSGWLPSWFKLSVQGVHQLQQHMIKVSFEMTGLHYQWSPMAHHSISMARQSSAQQCWLVWISGSVPASHPTHDNPMDWDLCIRLKYQRGYFRSELQFNYWFTLKNAHLSSNSYNFWMQPNIAKKFAMKFAGYVAWIPIGLCKYCKFGEKNYYNRGLLFWHALYRLKPFYLTVCHRD